MTKKALLISQLYRHSHNELIAFIDTDGAEKTGVFNKVSDDYPPLLAMFAVAHSVRMRMALGSSASEERLVLDEGKILGTVSVCLPSFTPMDSLSDSSSGKILPTSKKITTDSLMRANFAEKLVAEVISENDNARPSHVSLWGVTHHQSRGYRITRLLRENSGDTGGLITPQLINNPLQHDINQKFTLKPSDIDNFPNVAGRTCFPTNNYSLNSVPSTFFADSSVIQKLAGNPILKTKRGSISFQEQFFSPFLRN